MPLGVILSEVSNANEVEGSRTGDERARSPEDQRDEGSSARKRTRYRVREALPLQCAPVEAEAIPIPARFESCYAGRI